MKGIQFDLGTFYNKANNALVITKNIEGDYTPTTAKTYEFYVYMVAVAIMIPFMIKAIYDLVYMYQNRKKKANELEENFD